MDWHPLKNNDESTLCAGAKKVTLSNEPKEDPIKRNYQREKDDDDEGRTQKKKKKEVNISRHGNCLGIIIGYNCVFPKVLLFFI